MKFSNVWKEKQARNRQRSSIYLWKPFGYRIQINLNYRLVDQRLGPDCWAFVGCLRVGEVATAKIFWMYGRSGLGSYGVLFGFVGKAFAVICRLNGPEINDTSLTNLSCNKDFF